MFSSERKLQADRKVPAMSQRKSGKTQRGGTVRTFPVCWAAEQIVREAARQEDLGEQISLSPLINISTAISISSTVLNQPSVLKASWGAENGGEHTIQNINLASPEALR